MDERSSFVFHCEYRKFIRMLPVEEQLTIYDFLPDFAQSGGTAELPELSTAAQIVLLMITERMADEFQKYDKVRAERAEGGKKGGRPKKPKEDEGNLMDSEKPYGFRDNLKVFDKPEGFSKKQKNPVFVSVSESVSESDGVCVPESNVVPTEGTHTAAITLEDIRLCYESICKGQNVPPIPGEAERWQSYNFVNRERMKRMIASWVQDDIKIGKYSHPIKSKRSSIVNYEQSGTDWDAAADKAIALQGDSMEMETDELKFVDA